MVVINLVSAFECPSMEMAVWEQTAHQTSSQASAFGDLALPLLPSLYNVAFWLSRNSADAEDLVQATFLKALRGFESFETGTNFKVWIFRILRNIYLTSRSGLAAKSRVALEDKLNEEGGSWEEQYSEGVIDRRTPEIRLNDRTALYSAMLKLAPPLLEVVLLCDVEEMKYKEIASVLEIPIGTVMSRIARARAALRGTPLGKDDTEGGVPRMPNHLSLSFLSASAER